MDQSYRQLTVRIGWQLSKGLPEFGDDHEQDFDDFAKLVICDLRSLATVAARTVYSVGSTMREVKFSASTPLPREEWTDAIQSAAEACQVISEQSMWSFE